MQIMCLGLYYLGIMPFETFACPNVVTHEIITPLFSKNRVSRLYRLENCSIKLYYIFIYHNTWQIVSHK
jgi:hypothetical protein